MISSPPKIDLLPEHLIDQIKAGEVIERPGSLIKEILENAIDAEASKIELHIKNNGLDLISIKDNGHGMRFNEMPLAFSRHATSKIFQFEDLYQLRSFGFRGEALASIAAISKLQCISKTSEAESPCEIKIEGGLVTFHGRRQTNTFEHGTEIVIQELFFNTPVRLKFIQSQQTEKTFIRKIIYSFVLSNPQIEFQIKFDDLDKEIYSSRETLIDRVKDFFHKSNDLIIQSERFYEDYELEIFLVPGHLKSPVKIQNIYINNRYVLDRQLHRVTSNAMESSLGMDNFHYLVYFNLPPNTIDVNVHPNKTIIKVMESSKMISLLSSTVKDLSSSSHKVKNPSLLPAQEQSFFQNLNVMPTLQQERHQYNMDGLFSPHQILEDSKNFFWISQFFIIRQNQTWSAVSARKLLEHYTNTKIKSDSPSIPLLVSEPYLAKNVNPTTIETLGLKGFELDYLGKDTIVLRGIPEWMNGFPLRGIIQQLITLEPIRNLDINPEDWSQSTWEMMIDFFPLKELIQNGIVTDLVNILTEKLK